MISRRRILYKSSKTHFDTIIIVTIYLPGLLGKPFMIFISSLPAPPQLYTVRLYRYLTRDTRCLRFICFFFRSLVCDTKPRFRIAATNRYTITITHMCEYEFSNVLHVKRIGSSVSWISKNVYLNGIYKYNIRVILTRCISNIIQSGRRENNNTDCWHISILMYCTRDAYADAISKVVSNVIIISRTVKKQQDRNLTTSDLMIRILFFQLQKHWR